ncbi:zinc ribbon domain-containing protein [Paracoccus sp. M683]|uniref:zinc ribbon domain-containing protein n=1 Tax=Paracoccus sp. M683 TaxID=2594268 RepID=UPI001180B759|nr:zinc ribbon domain-containing protein [Paracoccus sp. M683]TRW95214.1 zinc ribbon domain-containing protein [Paracoccus sp. M683]
MPVYDFNCAAHGLFTDRLSYEASRAGAPCPCCGGNSAVLPALPQVSTLSSGLRKAENRAEASSAAPRVVKRSHLPSCGCNMCKKKAPPTSRKWMLGQC